MKYKCNKSEISAFCFSRFQKKKKKMHNTNTELYVDNKTRLLATLDFTEYYTRILS